MKGKIPRVHPIFAETEKKLIERLIKTKISEEAPHDVGGLYLARDGTWKKIADINKVEMATPKTLKVMTLESAIALAATAHRGQLDLGGQPYILHPLRVMSKFSTYDGRMAAVLHDVVEDTTWTINALEHANIPIGIVKAVESLTRRKDKGELYMDYIERVCRNHLARLVKIEDLRDNLDLSRFKLEEIQKYTSLIRREQRALAFCLSAEKDNYS